MKTKLLIIATLLVSIAMFSTGAFAYFSSQNVTHGNISSGNLTLRVATGDCTSWSDTAQVWSMANMAPGDFVDGKLCMKNEGNVNAKQVTFEWVYDAALKPLADKIILVSAYDSADGGVDQIGAITAMCDSIGAPAVGIVDGKCSLPELAYLSNATGWPFDAVSGNPGTTFLPGGSSAWLYMKFQFDPLADDTFQSKAFDYTLNVTARQNQVFP